jgi:hypothetical protein
MILKNLAMILKDPTKNPAGSCHDPVRSYQNFCKILPKLLQDLAMILQDHVKI